MNKPEEIVEKIKRVAQVRFGFEETRLFLDKFIELSKGLTILDFLIQISTDEGDELEIGFFTAEEIFDITLSRGKVYSCFFPVMKIQNIFREDLESKVVLNIFGEKKFDYNVVKPGSIEALKRYESSLQSHRFGIPVDCQDD
jgi:hypothetical protein